MSEETIRQLCLWAAGALTALWGGSKVPWKRLRLAVWPTWADVAEDFVVDLPEPKAPKDTHPNGSVADAIYVLRVNAPDAEFQKLVTAVDDGWWQRQEKVETK